MVLTLLFLSAWSFTPTNTKHSDGIRYEFGPLQELELTHEYGL